MMNETDGHVQHSCTNRAVHALSHKKDIHNHIIAWVQSQTQALTHTCTHKSTRLHANTHTGVLELAKRRHGARPHSVCLRAQTAGFAGTAAGALGSRGVATAARADGDEYGDRAARQHRVKVSDGVGPYR